LRKAQHRDLWSKPSMRGREEEKEAQEEIRRELKKLHGLEPE
jgi:uncharacterized protein VirK/YbjX